MTRDLIEHDDFDQKSFWLEMGYREKADGSGLEHVIQDESFIASSPLVPAIMELRRVAFARLRKAIEDPNDSRASWDDPRATFEIEYSIPDIRMFRAPELPSGVDDNYPQRWASHGYLNTARRLGSVIDALCMTTRLAAWLRRDGATVPMIPVPYEQAFKRMNDEEQAAFRAKTFSPVELSRDVHGVRKVFMIYPLVIDTDAECAWFTVSAEFLYQTAASPPSDWPDEQKEHLWSEIGNEPFDEPVTLLDGGTRAAMAVSLVSRDDDRPVYPLAFGQAMGDAHSMALVQNAHKLRFPRTLKKIRQWSDIEADEIADLKGSLSGDVDNYSDDELETIGLKRKPQRGTKREDWPLSLTAKHKKNLRFERGQHPDGFLDLDRNKRAAIYKAGRDSRGQPIEMWLSWDGSGAPFLTGDLKRMISNLQEKLAAHDNADQLSLFRHMPDEAKQQLEQKLDRLNLYNRGRRLMEVLLGAVSRGHRNPVTIPASAFRDLFWNLAGKPPPKNWKRDVEEVLSGCMALSAIWKAVGKGAYGQTSFIGDWEYVPAGAGRHGDGAYLINVQAPFVGCLSLFEAGRSEISRSRKTIEPRPLLDNVIRYDFSAKLAKDDRKTLNYIRFDAGRPFYDQAAGLSAEQSNLHRWIEDNITLNHDTARRKDMKIRRNAAGADSPRLYDSTWCPLLPEGSQFVGALGHFSRSPEAGRTLGGTASRSGHADGLIAVAEYQQKPGRAHNQREEIARRILEDLKAVAVEYLAGHLVGKLNAGERTDDGDGVQWLQLDELATLDYDTLTKRVKMFIFLPADWKARRQAHFEAKSGRKVTESQQQAEAAYQAQLAGQATPAPMATPTKPEDDGTTILPGAPVQNRLYGAMKIRGLKNVDVARIFHVDKATVGRWIYGMKDGQDDPTKARRIPGDLAALMHRWVDANQEPTLEELESLESRKRSPARK